MSATLTETSAWTLVERLPSGHRLFRHADRPDDLAVADLSGGLPPHTDDGVLWVDQTLPISVLSDARGSACLLPVLTENGEESATPICAATALHLAARYDLEVRVAASMTLYTVTRQE